MAEYTFRTVVYCTLTVTANSHEEADEIISEIDPLDEIANHDYDAWELIGTEDSEPEEGGLEVDEEIHRMRRLAGM